VEPLVDGCDTPIVVPQPVVVMDSAQHESDSVDIPARASTPPNAIGLLLSRDLIFTTKIKATAAEFGYRIQAVSDVVLAESLIREQQPRVVLIDLSAGDLCAPPALRGYRTLAGSETWFVAFGSHVDADALAGARVAGCQVAMPRSRFASELPELIQRYFSDPPPSTS
jgi:hypothetical protein